MPGHGLAVGSGTSMCQILVVQQPEPRQKPFCLMADNAAKISVRQSWELCSSVSQGSWSPPRAQ